MNNIDYLLALHTIDGLGPVRLKAVIDYFKDPKLAWEADLGEIRKIGVPQTVVQRLADARKNLHPDQYLQGINKAGIRWMSIFDEDYPKLLKEIYDPPVILFYKGERAVLNRSAIAVVGSRKMSGYGKAVTEQFTKSLTNAGLTIVSGLARGVDSEAHKTAVAQNGKTIAVLGGGLNNIFPPENIHLSTKIAEGFGIVISEFPPESPSLPGNFPARNRIISGLSLAVLVIEAAADSGSLITAKLALEQGREVFAVPGPVTSALSKGPISLIQNGAKAVYSPDEILEDLGIERVMHQKTGFTDQVKVSEDELKVLQILEDDSKHIDEIGRELLFSSSKISAMLLKMEISGLVQSVGAGIYCKKKPCPI